MQYINKAAPEAKPRFAQKKQNGKSQKTSGAMQYKPRNVTDKKMFSDLATYQPKKTTDSTCSSSPNTSNDNISSPESQVENKPVEVLYTSFNQQHQNPEELNSSFFCNDHESSFPVSNEKKFKSCVLIENES